MMWQFLEQNNPNGSGISHRDYCVKHNKWKRVNILHNSVSNAFIYVTITSVSDYGTLNVT